MTHIKSILFKVKVQFALILMNALLKFMIVNKELSVTTFPDFIAVLRNSVL